MSNEYNFTPFASKVHDKFNEIQNLLDHELYVVKLDNQDIFDVYLESFPEGTNPLYRERTYHDCSCCKNFIRNLGRVVAIDSNNQIVSIWDVDGLDYPYNIVAKKLSKFVHSLPIENIYRTKHRGFGNEYTIELIKGNETKKWHHFHGVADLKYQNNDPGHVLSSFKSSYDVFYRGLNELSVAALNDVIELIKDNSLYRGQEHLKSVKGFLKHKKAFDKLSDDNSKSLYAWKNVNDSVARFRNTVIGTLIQDISSGVSLEDAVKAFENKVAPANYKRPKALITPSMVKDAMKTIEELGIQESLERRFAKLSDVSVNNVLFVNNSVQSKMKDGIENLLMEEVKVKTKPSKGTQKISIDDFMNNIVPNSKSIEIMLKSNHAGNFMSLTAPIHEMAKPIFQWNNNFGWSYDGNVTDSIKERVKKAGGNVDAELRVSLGWHNSDDLDIHCYTPNGMHIYFGDKKGILDVDMNAGGQTNNKNPVENLQWSKMPLDGKYEIHVNQYNRRSSVRPGFELEVEYKGKISNYVHEKGLSDKKTVHCLELIITNGELSNINVLSPKNVVGGSYSIEKWGIQTEQFVSVDTIMYSPNHWDENNVGNKHWFFILSGCKNPNPTRGIYNEFLKSELGKHRKVFEILGDKTKCENTMDQLSGVGFSSTQKNTVLLKVDNKPYEVQF